MKKVKHKYVEDETTTHEWSSDFSRAAEAYLDVNFPGHHHYRIGRFSVVTDAAHTKLMAAPIYPDLGGWDEFSADRVTQFGNVITTLFRIKNREKKPHPLHAAIFFDIQSELLGWKGLSMKQIQADANRP